MFQKAFVFIRIFNGWKVFGNISSLYNHIPDVYLYGLVSPFIYIYIFIWAHVDIQKCSD